jgi:hypothetical protein
LKALLFDGNLQVGISIYLSGTRRVPMEEKSNNETPLIFIMSSNALGVGHS